MTDGCDVFVIIGSCRKRWESFFIATLRRIIYLKDEVIAIMDDLTLLSNVTNALSGSTSVLSIPNISELIQSFTNSSNGDGSQEVQA